MIKLTEQDVFRPFIGKSVNQDASNGVMYQNGGSQYFVANADYINDQQLLEAFGITDRLKWMWQYGGVDFSVYIYIENGIITKGNLYKAKEGGGGHGRSVSRVLAVSQQELRVARRILQYITSEN